jgi:hypothetical protein
LLAARPAWLLRFGLSIESASAPSGRDTQPVAHVVDSRDRPGQLTNVVFHALVRDGSAQREAATFAAYLDVTGAWHELDRVVQQFLNILISGGPCGCPRLIAIVAITVNAGTPAGTMNGVLMFPAITDGNPGFG